MSSKDPLSGTEAIRILSSHNLQVHLDAVDLQVVAGPDAGLHAHFCLSLLRIGTAPDNDVVLTDRAVSRHHAEIRMTSQGLQVRDLGSTNGTFIGGLRVTEAYLEPGVECTLGYSRLLVTQRTEERPVAVLAGETQLGGLVGASPPMCELYALIRAVAPTPVTVHITGESGSGKEMVARTLHELSGRSGAFVVFDASVADPEMIRNDLFGHVKGAFTGASGAREGAFRRAHGGTLFIDEIGELPLDLQPRLLRALESREVVPIGSDIPQRVDVRVITATHRNLQQMVQEGTFRADLFYRLSVVPIRVPPLREIKSDIPRLAEHLRHVMRLESSLSADALAVLEQYSWPGNVRELRNVLERAAVLCQGGVIRPHHLHLPNLETVARPSLPNAPSESKATPTPPLTAIPTEDNAASRAQLKELEKKMIMEAMARNHNNKAAVARELGIPLSTLKRRLKDYQI